MTLFTPIWGVSDYEKGHEGLSHFYALQRNTIVSLTAKAN